jgi:TRAP-type C4-dicarboxylate transport system permease small subunit
MAVTSTGEGRVERETRSDVFLKSVHGLSRHFLIVGEIALTFMMFLTVADVIMRSFRKPIVGTYEIVAFSAAVAIGFSLPLTSWMRGHVFVDLFTAKRSPRTRTILNVATRCIVMAFFFLVGWRLIRYGMNLHRVKEVSMTLLMPFYPVAFGLAVCAFTQCLVMICDIIKIARGTYE